MQICPTGGKMLSQQIWPHKLNCNKTSARSKNSKLLLGFHVLSWRIFFFFLPKSVGVASHLHLGKVHWKGSDGHWSTPPSDSSANCHWRWSWLGRSIATVCVPTLRDWRQSGFERSASVARLGSDLLFSFIEKILPASAAIVKSTAQLRLFTRSQ